MSLTEVALTVTLISMFAAALASMWSSRGYSFDLRNKASRRRDPNRQGGRRMDDRIPA
jgi:hypothetical protein